MPESNYNQIEVTSMNYLFQGTRIQQALSHRAALT